MRGLRSFALAAALVLALPGTASALLAGTYSGTVFEMRSREAAIGSRHDITWVFYAFNTTWPGTDLSQHLADGRTVIANLGPERLRGGHTWADIANGAGEAKVREIGRVLRDLHTLHPGRVWFSFAQEPETEVEQGNDGNQPQHFRPAWRRVHGWIRAEGFQGKFIVVTGSADQESWWTTYYPGHAFVDIIGADEFTWAHDPATNTFESEYTGPRNAIKAHAVGKPWLAASGGMDRAHGDARRSEYIRAIPAIARRWSLDSSGPLLGMVWWDRGTFVLTPGTYAAWREATRQMQRRSSMRVGDESLCEWLGQVCGL